MSNPIINRWGLNLFWYRFWYNDKNNSLIIHQDELINKLIFLYTHYGLLYSKNLFINKYWFANYKINYNSFYDLFNLKYFRLMEYKNKILNQYKSYKLRSKIKNLYFSKIWILRYQNWLIINFYCFQPFLKKNKKYLNNSKDFNFYLTSFVKNKFYINRYKMFIFYFLNIFINKNIYFSF